MRSGVRGGAGFSVWGSGASRMFLRLDFAGGRNRRH